MKVDSPMEATKLINECDEKMSQLSQYSYWVIWNCKCADKDYYYIGILGFSRELTAAIRWLQYTGYLFKSRETPIGLYSTGMVEAETPSKFFSFDAY